jgi:hypothetical protein
MKDLKMLGFAALAAMATMAFIGAGTASATELYKYTTPSANDTLGVETTILGSLTGGTAKLTSTSGTLLDTCTGGEVDIDVEDAGGATKTVLGKITALTWSGCIEPTESVKLADGTYGTMEIHHITGTTNGTVTGKNSVVKVNTTIFEAICEYTVGSALHLGTLIGAKSSTGHATLAINTVVPAKNSFFCPDAKWEANYTVTTPTGLMVEAS